MNYEDQEAMNAALPLPDWAHEQLQLVTCTHCGHHFRPEGVVASGVRRAPSGHPSFFAEVICAKCRVPSLCVFNALKMSITVFNRSMTASLIGDGHDLFRAATRKHRAEEEAKVLESLGSHDEFLHKIGVTPEQIDQWATYRRNGRDRGQQNNSDVTEE